MWCSYGGHDVDDKCFNLQKEHGEYNCEKYCPYSNTSYWGDDEILKMSDNVVLYVIIGLLIIFFLIIIK